MYQESKVILFIAKFQFFSYKKFAIFFIKVDNTSDIMWRQKAVEVENLN